MEKNVSLELEDRLFAFKCIFKILEKTFVFEWNNVPNPYELPENYTGVLKYFLYKTGNDKHPLSLKLTTVRNGCVRGQLLKRSVLNITDLPLVHFSDCLKK